MDISSNKLLKRQTRRPGHSNEKGNLKEKLKLVFVAQNNAKITNYMKVKIDNAQQNWNCRLCGDKNKTIHHVVSECSTLVKK